MDKEIRKSLGLMIMVALYIATIIVVFCLIEYALIDAFIIAVLIVGLTDMAKQGLRIVKKIFKIELADLDTIQSDDIQPLETQ